MDRFELIDKIRKLLMHGNSVTITGIRGLGKGFLTKDIIEHSQDDISFVNIDCSEIISVDILNFYKLIYSQLSVEIKKYNPKYVIKSEILDEPLLLYMEIKVLLESLADATPVTLIIRDLNKILSLEISTFNSLKSLRFVNNDKISFLFLINPEQIEHFTEDNMGDLYDLFSSRIIWTPIPDEETTNRVIDHCASKFKLSVSESDRKAVSELATGHYSLTRSILEYIFYGGDISEISKLMSEQNIVESLVKVYSNLTSTEQQILKKIVENQKISEVEINQLSKIQIYSDGQIKPPILHRYLSTNSAPKNDEIPTQSAQNTELITLVGNEFHFNGRSAVKPFTQKEFKVFACMYDNVNQVVSREDIGVALWGSDSQFLYSDWAIDQTISRIRKKVALTLPDSDVIQTIKGRGFKLNTSPPQYL